MGVLLCPVCLSGRIVFHLGGYAGVIYKCQDCGYVGPIVLEVDKEEYEKLLKKMEYYRAQSRNRL